MKAVFKKYIAIFATIFLGAIGSALWDICKNNFGSFYYFLLNLTTLGFNSLRDQMYIDISKGYHEEFSLKIFTILCYLIIAAGVMVLLSYRMLVKQNDLFEKDLKNLEIIESKLQKTKRKTKILASFCIPYFIFASIIITIQLLQANYVNDAILNYDQLINIAKPYSSTHEIDLFNSRFAMLNNKEDYVKITNELKDIIIKNGVNAPIFNVF